MIKSNYPWVESPFFNEIIKTKNLTEEQKNLATDYHNNGFIVLSDFLPMDLINQVQKDTEEIGFDMNYPIKTHRNTERIQDFWQLSKASQELAAYKPILDVLQMLYGKEPFPFQTLNFNVGTQQRAHSDTIHFSSLPSKFMCGVWVALEDITKENGPLFYYPGSHRLPEYNFSQIIDNAKSTTYEDYSDYEDFIEEIVKVSPYERKVFTAKKGDALVWSSNILHGGMPVLKTGSSRWSQVTHYFFKDCYYYTPMLSNMVTDELYLRKMLVNIATGEKVVPSYNGQKLNYLKTSKTQYVLNNHGNRTQSTLKLLIKNLFRRTK